MNKFDEWFDEGGVDGGIHHSDGFELSQAAWSYQQERISEVIERLEEYPCDMTDLRGKENLIKILKEELSG